MTVNIDKPLGSEFQKLYDFDGQGDAPDLDPEKFKHQFKELLTDRPLVNLGEGFCYRRPGISPKKILAHCIKLGFLLDVPKNPLIDGTEKDFSDSNNPVPCSKHPSDINAIYEAAIKAGKIRELFFEIVSHPKDYYAFRFGLLGVNQTEFSPLGLFECACTNESNAYNRFVTGRRKRFEKAVIENITTHFSDKKEKIRLVSFGCGGLLQDLQVLGLLCKEGYANFSVTLIDPEGEIELVDRLENFFQNILTGISLETQTFCDADPAFEMFVEKKLAPHAVMAIDFDEIDEQSLSQIIKFKELLHEKGKLYLGAARYDHYLSTEDAIPPEVLQHAKARTEFQKNDTTISILAVSGKSI